MAISQNRFVVVDTGYVRNSRYGERSFCGRCFTTSPKAPFGKVVEVFDADGAKEFFGAKKDDASMFSASCQETDEYAFAKKYFSYRTNAGRSPYKLSFVRWTPHNINGWLKATVACPSWNELREVGVYDDYNLEINTTKSKIVVNLSDLRNCVGLSDPSSNYSLVGIINRKLSSSSLPDFIVGGTATIEGGCLKIAFPDGKTGDVANRETLLSCTGGRVATVLGLTNETGVICSNFAIGEDPASAVSRVSSFNDDFGSFMFFDWMSSYGLEVLPNERIRRILSIAKWNHAQNYKYMFIEALPDSWDDDGTSMSTVYVQDKISSDLTGTAICSFKNSGSVKDMNGYRYDEFMPMSVLASTDFTSAEATQNYMFQSCDNADVAFIGEYAEKAESALSGSNINFYGEVQSVGARKAFFMPGKMLNGEDMSVYACEMYIKEAISTWLVNLFLDNDIVRGTRSDLTRIAVGIDGIVKEAKTNGIVTDGYRLDSEKRLYVNSVTGSEEGYAEFEKDGYCLSVRNAKEGGKDAVAYVLVYNRSGQIRKIEGKHIILV